MINMTVEETLNEYNELSTRQGRWGSHDECAIVYLAHTINQMTSVFNTLIKEMRGKKF